MGEERDADIQAVYEHLADITRRATARSRKLSEPLTFVEHSLLRHIAHSPGTRATDVASAFQLNRSTVSRQVGELIRLGLVRYSKHEDDGGRGRILELTDAGQERLSRSAIAQQQTLTERLAEWSDAGIAEFAAVLARFNASSDD